ncbi:MAG: FHA domain-containing protein [Gammaproteobacteria bacterium HGW-Gammaproteobacteria-13]|uniref:FHA domain-containing protein n=1 Tax=Pseudomonas sp. TaxID=306 RepID=UPI000CC5FD28|nr:FHA domain-containing protein [Pseudomonas sp.]MDP2746355.1 FHA domain-containing protein [Pseudomonas sp.]MDZ4334465.1 FHA domain-containing protein [Pseudomonas sp.]PKM23760.1 MAG: FHA domain-containing protein [Gammaproteobacteria bacterium HGW-Gammaproteobacteria-13]
MLKIHFSDNRQAPIWLVDERFTIGQDSRNSLVLVDPSIGPFHAEIRQDHGFYYLTDVGSPSGSFVNDERINTRFQLRADDRVRLGSVELLLVDPARSKTKAEQAARWYLQVIQGEHEGKKFHINGSMTFGRSVKCELCFSDQELSRRHCEFYLKDDVLEVKDLASANGLLVNQQKVSTAVLQPGDQLKMGSVSLLVIGPKSTVAPSEDEDATLFMRAVDLPKPLKPAPLSSSPSSQTNPLRTAAQANPMRAAAPASAPSGLNKPLLALGLLLVTGLLVAAALFAL